MKKVILLLIMPFISLSQNIKWENIDYDMILPSIIQTKGVIQFYNGVITPYGDLYIDENSKSVYFQDNLKQEIFKINQSEIQSLGTPLYKNGSNVPIDEIFGEFSSEFFGALRKSTYKDLDLNEFIITTVFGNPKFEIKEKKLNVSNKFELKAKLLSISPNTIEYLDSLGNIIVQSNNKTNVLVGGFDRNTNRKIMMKSSRIFNIKFMDKLFINVRDLYDFLYNSYKTKFEENLIDFKESYKGKDFELILNEWGPFNEKHQLKNNNSLFVWSFPKVYSESQSNSRVTSTSSLSSSSSSITDIYGSLSSNYAINSNYQVIPQGYQSVINSYSSIKGDSFLNYYSSNTQNQYSQSITSTRTSQRGSRIDVDITNKISLIVDENNFIVNVLEKNYFQDPYYGIVIKFYK